MTDETGTATPAMTDRASRQAQLDVLPIREKAHTPEGTRSLRPAGGCPWSRSTPSR